MWKCPKDLEHNTVYVYTGTNESGGFEGFVDTHIVWCNECATVLTVDDMSGETDYSGEGWEDSPYNQIPQPAKPTMNLLADPKGGIPIKEYSFSFDFFKKRFKTRD